MGWGAASLGDGTRAFGRKELVSYTGVNVWEKRNTQLDRCENFKARKWLCSDNTELYNLLCLRKRAWCNEGNTHTLARNDWKKQRKTYVSVAGLWLDTWKRNLHNAFISTDHSIMTVSWVNKFRQLFFFGGGGAYFIKLCLRLYSVEWQRSL
jgi:hypothetical protein